MSQNPPPAGLEPLETFDTTTLPTRPRTIRTGLRLNIRGRSVHLVAVHK